MPCALRTLHPLQRRGCEDQRALLRRTASATHVAELVLLWLRRAASRAFVMGSLRCAQQVQSPLRASSLSLSQSPVRVSSCGRSLYFGGELLNLRPQTVICKVRQAVSYSTSAGRPAAPSPPPRVSLQLLPLQPDGFSHAAPSLLVRVRHLAATPFKRSGFCAALRFSASGQLAWRHLVARCRQRATCSFRFHRAKQGQTQCSHRVSIVLESYFKTLACFHPRTAPRGLKPRRRASDDRAHPSALTKALPR